MKYLIFALAALIAACSEKAEPKPEPQPEPEKAVFAKGADISWATEMESKGQKFYDADGKEVECTALFKEIGFNAVRFRVWVNPSNKWSSAEDVVEKSRRAQQLGMKIMIDFHYSDWWADPQKQNIPAAWKGHTADQLAVDVADHTRNTLQMLKNAGVDVEWVQVGNEVTNGMLWETCRVKGQEAANFVKCFNAGAKAVKEVYPNATVILHVDNGWKIQTLTWFYDLMKTAGADYDMIGLSLYPSYWENNGYPDWTPKTKQFVENLSPLHARYEKPIMLVEFGMPAAQPAQSKAALQYILDNTKDYKDWFQGIFFWEPESEKSRNGYDYGAFQNGRPTEALDPFKD